MGKYFGTDGFRGEANVKLNAEHAFKIGRFLGWYFGKTKRARIVIGKDTRRSGDMLENAVAAGLNSCGADVFLMGVTTTPSVSYIVKNELFSCGIMISASHNPYYDNGIKLINYSGNKMEAEIENMIEKYIDENVPDIENSIRGDIGKTIFYAEGKQKYIDHLISASHKNSMGYKIGIDCANGSASPIANKVFNGLGLDPMIINADPNGDNINQDCGSTHIEALSKLVAENKLEAGFAYDGDADRCLAVDEDGKIVDGDRIMYIIGCYLKSQGRLNSDMVVTTVMSNIGLYKAFDNAGIKSVKTAVGDKYVHEEMENNGYSLGGEQSGHIILSEYAQTGDGILTSLMLLEAMHESGKSLKELADEVEIYPQLLKNVKVIDKEKVLSNQNIKDCIDKVENELAGEGRVLVRPSGTEPLIRVMVEAKSDDICSEKVDIIIQAIKAEGLEVGL